MHDVATSGVVGPAFSTASEDTSATQFESPDAGFMVNWPYVWAQAKTKVEAGTLEQSVPDDYGWTLYPRVDADTPSAPPLGGINLGVSAFSKHADFAYQATVCITSDENQAYYMVTNGNPASSAAVYDDPEVKKDYPMADDDPGVPGGVSAPSAVPVLQRDHRGPAARVPPAGRRLDRHRQEGR